MASIPIVLSRSPDKGAGGTLLDRILGGAKGVAKGAGDLIQGVLGNATVQKVGDTLLDVYVARQAARIERDLSRERPELAQAGVNGSNGTAVYTSSPVTGGEPMLSGGLVLPLALGAGLLLLVVLALRR